MKDKIGIIGHCAIGKTTLLHSLTKELTNKQEVIIIDDSPFKESIPITRTHLTEIILPSEIKSGQQSRRERRKQERKNKKN